MREVRRHSEFHSEWMTCVWRTPQALFGMLRDPVLELRSEDRQADIRWYVMLGGRSLMLVGL